MCPKGHLTNDHVHLNTCVVAKSPGSWESSPNKNLLHGGGAAVNDVGAKNPKTDFLRGG